MKYRDVQERLRLLGIVISKRGCHIRVNHFGGTEDTACFASSLEDALQLGLTMAKSVRLPANWCSHR